MFRKAVGHLEEVPSIVSGGHLCARAEDSILCALKVPPGGAQFPSSNHCPDLSSSPGLLSSRLQLLY